MMNREQLKAWLRENLQLLYMQVDYKSQPDGISIVTDPGFDRTISEVFFNQNFEENLDVFVSAMEAGLLPSLVGKPVKLEVH